MLPGNVPTRVALDSDDAQPLEQAAIAEVMEDIFDQTKFPDAQPRWPDDDENETEPKKALCVLPWCSVDAALLKQRAWSHKTFTAVLLLDLVLLSCAGAYAKGPDCAEGGKGGAAQGEASGQGPRGGGGECQ